MPASKRAGDASSLQHPVIDTLSTFYTKTAYRELVWIRYNVIMMSIAACILVQVGPAGKLLTIISV